MSQPVWITPAGSLGSIPEGVFYQNTLLVIAGALPNTPTCTATTAGTNIITCTSTAGLYPDLNVMFSGTTFGGISSSIRYFVLDVISATQFRITDTEFSSTPVALTTATGSMTAEFRQHVYYSLIAGSLPPGIQCSDNGLIVGVPSALASLQGVPFDVNRDVTSKFTIRAYTQKPVGNSLVVDRIRDRTFTITVVNTNAPVFASPSNLGSYYDGDRLNIQLQIDNVGVNAPTVVTLIGGELPGEVSVSPTGLIYGYIQPAVNVDKPPGYDLTPEGVYPYDFVVSAINKNYQFTLQVTDGVSTDIKTFNFYVYNRNTLNASTTQITADNDFITADETEERRPFIVNSLPENLGTVRSDNYYAHQFIANDYDTPDLKYAIGINSGAVLPPGLALDPNSGWYYGYIPDQGVTEVAYSFNIVTYQADFVGTPITCTATTAGANVITCNSTAQLRTGQPIVFTGTSFGGITASPTQVYYVYTGTSTGKPASDTQFQITSKLDSTSVVSLTTATGSMTANLIVASNPYPFELTVNGAVNAEVVWLTPGDLGYIENGATSMLVVQAENVGGRTLKYRLKPGAVPPPFNNYVPGVYNLLPQGLELLPSGEISGRVTFNTFAIDLGTTTFDATQSVVRNLTVSETTFDSTFTFTVNAYAEGDVVSVDKTFTVQVKRVYNKPYQNLLIEAMPPVNDRATIAELLNNQEIFVPDYIYRIDDPYFGKSERVIYQHAFGLAPDTLETYVSSLYENHYWKNLVLGEIDTAQAIDPITGEVVYEVVYSKIIDDLVNTSGASVNKIVNLPYDIIDPADGSTQITQVYPNSLVNMRDQVIDVVGQISTKLPLWMTSKQTNGRVLGFTPAWVLCYTKPGRSQQIAYYVQTQFQGNLNAVDFKVDRYVLDHTLSRNWDTTTQNWTPKPSLTTFDRYGSGVLPFVGYVDIATQLAFTDVNQRSLDYIADLGGLDGQITGINDKTIIFVKQEYYTDYANPDDAWQDYTNLYGNDYSPETEGNYFDEGFTVPGGYTYNCTDANETNNYIKADTTAGLYANDPVWFTGSTFGGVNTTGSNGLTQIYTVNEVVSTSCYATASVGNLITCDSTAYLNNDDVVWFSDNTFGGVNAFTASNTIQQYYVTKASPTTFHISLTLGGGYVTLSPSSLASAGSFIIGHKYKIKTVGTTNFVALGASANSVGTEFVATATGTVVAGNFVVGKSYTISDLGTTDFVTIGASANTVGITFTATGNGTGTGTATQGNGDAYNVMTVNTSYFSAVADLQTAGSFEIDKYYTIASVGTTNFTAYGAGSNTVGTVFKATGSGTGTGTAYLNAVQSTPTPPQSMALNFGNTRMAVYTIHVDPVTTIVTLTPTQLTAQTQYVQVLQGRVFGGAQLYYPTSPAEGYTLVNWINVPASSSTETTFDGASMAFEQPVDMYDPTDRDDKYLVFPKANILV